MPRKRGMECLELRYAMLSLTETARSVEEREFVPEKACGKCKNYFQSGAGMCNILKMGSNISATPPVYVIEGNDRYIIDFNTNGESCKFFENMDIIDKDISHSFDPKVSRHQRQMSK